MVFGFGVLVDGGHNLSSDGSCNFTAPGSLNNTDPLLGPLQDNGGPNFTHALSPGSPAIDKGKDFGDLTTDQGDVAFARTFNPNSEVGLKCDGVFWGAHAARVWFSAARRKHRSANFVALESPGTVGGKRSGGTPELTREPRVLPIPFSEFGFKAKFQIRNPSFHLQSARSDLQCGVGVVF